MLLLVLRLRLLLMGLLVVGPWRLGRRGLLAGPSAGRGRPSPQAGSLAASARGPNAASSAKQRAKGLVRRRGLLLGRRRRLGGRRRRPALAEQLGLVAIGGRLCIAPALLEELQQVCSRLLSALGVAALLVQGALVGGSQRQPP